ncbi:MAG: zinc ribbon domain-containing protein [Candidatus Methanofastidiosia archaeon]
MKRNYVFIGVGILILGLILGALSQVQIATEEKQTVKVPKVRMVEKTRLVPKTRIVEKQKTEKGALKPVWGEVVATVPFEFKEDSYIGTASYTFTSDLPHRFVIKSGPITKDKKNGFEIIMAWKYTKSDPSYDILRYINRSPEVSLCYLYKKLCTSKENLDEKSEFIIDPEKVKLGERINQSFEDGLEVVFFFYYYEFKKVEGEEGWQPTIFNYVNKPYFEISLLSRYESGERTITYEEEETYYEEETYFEEETYYEEEITTSLKKTKPLSALIWLSLFLIWIGIVILFYGLTKREESFEIGFERKLPSKCPYCGTKLQKGYVYCLKCGKFV